MLIRKLILYLHKNARAMTFDKILENSTLWAVRYEGAEDNVLQQLFSQWSSPEWLVDFFLENMADLESYFKIRTSTKPSMIQLSWNLDVILLQVALLSLPGQCKNVNILCKS